MKKQLIEKMMLEAITLAKRALNKTLPNPRVGAVIFDDDGNIKGAGYHKCFGLAHAEIEAINDAMSKGHDIRRCNICVTLEPCNHQGKTPPCTNAIIDAGLKAIYIGVKDDCPGVSGCGMEHLLSQGLKLECGILEDECRALNPGFNKFNRSGLPFLQIKSAISLNGKINNLCSTKNDNKWFTGPEAREYVHELRACSDLIITGLGTIKLDDPKLNVRSGQKIIGSLGSVVPSLASNVAILDPKLELIDKYISGSLNVAKAGNRVFIVCDSKINLENTPYYKELKSAKISLIRTDLNSVGLIDLKILLKKLAHDYGFREIFVEAGGELTSSFLMLGADCIDRFTLFIAPVWFNKESKSLLENSTFPDMKINKTKLLGNTICLQMSPKF